jgi:hypothetical protein
MALHYWKFFSNALIMGICTRVMTNKPSLSDQPLFDTTEYGSGPDDSISDVTENAAVTGHSITINGATISYTARAGHLLSSSRLFVRTFHLIHTDQIGLTSCPCQGTGSEPFPRFYDDLMDGAPNRFGFMIMQGTHSRIVRGRGVLWDAYSTIEDSAELVHSLAIASL